MANYFRPYLHIGVNCIGQGIEYTRNNCYRNISDDSTFTYVVLANGYILGFSTIDSNSGLFGSRPMSTTLFLNDFLVSSTNGER